MPHGSSPASRSTPRNVFGLRRHAFVAGSPCLRCFKVLAPGGRARGGGRHVSVGGCIWPKGQLDCRETTSVILYWVAQSSGEPRLIATRRAS